MGSGASSLLDEARSADIKGRVEAELKDFSPYYRKQFSVARFAQVEDELEHNRQKITQLLKQKEAPKESIVLYEDAVCYLDESRKWKERYVVVRANYCLEYHESLHAYVKGAAPLHKLLPTGGAVLTTEEAYMEMVDRCYPGDSSVKEEFAPPLSGMPGHFPVYLRLPYRKDSYFCFRQQAKQAAFISILSDCIKHQNQDFLKKKTCEVQAFLKAVQLYRQDRGCFEAWDMLIGSDVRVMANLVMEKLLPSLGTELLPRLRARKSDRRRVWFTTMEAAYFLVQAYLLEGLSTLKEECRAAARRQEVLMHSDMDQILAARRQLEEKIRAKVSKAAEQLCAKSVQPYLGSVLEELMEPISSGFLDGRRLMEANMDEVCRDVLKGVDNETLKQVLVQLARPDLLSCYKNISSLQERLQNLEQQFGFSTITAVSHGAQIDLQQLIENAAYTFELLLKKAVEDNPETAGAAVDKVKHRVLKQYDYDSSTVRKRIFQDSLVSITLPFIKKNLADTCRTELQAIEQTVYVDYSSFIHVENVYENILLQILDKEVSKVVKEAASLKKYNLFTESSRSSLSSTSTPSSPASVPASSVRSTAFTSPSPLAVNGLPPGREAELKKDSPRADKPPAAEAVQKVEVKVEKRSREDLEPPASAAADTPSEPGDTAESQEELSGKPKPAAESETQRAKHQVEAEIIASVPVAEQPTEPSSKPPPEPPSEPRVEPLAAAPRPDATSEPATTSKEAAQSQNSAVGVEAPFCDGAAEDVRLQLKVEEAVFLTASDPNSLDVSVGSESPRSELESTEGLSETSDLLEVAQKPSTDRTSIEEPSEVQRKAVSSGGDTETEATVETPKEPSEVQTEAVSSPGNVEAGATAETPEEPASCPPAARPPDCGEEIEVEEPVHHYPKKE